MTKEAFTQHINSEIKRLFPDSWICAQVFAVGIINGYRLACGDNVPEWLYEVVERDGYSDSWADKD